MRAAAATVLALALAVIGLTPATAAGGENVWETAYAVYPSDGDTVWVCLEGKPCDPKKQSTWTSVRLMSIQAMEVVHKGVISKEAQAAGVPSMRKNQCHGPEATRALNELVFGKATWDTAKKSPHQLRLKSKKKASSSYGRLRRTIEVNRDGQWIDVQAELLKQGHVMFMPLPSALGEDAHNVEYNTLAQEAAAAGANLWDTDYCKAGPSQNHKLELDIRYDANGDDMKNVNGEWIRIRNTSPTRINLKGWSLRTASWQVFDFTKNVYVEPNNWILVHSGKKPKTVKPRHYYMGYAKPFLQNTQGGGAYLFDGDGDMRAWQMYNCYFQCATNPGFAVTKTQADAKGVDAKNVNGEYIKIKNTSKATIRLAGYHVKVGSKFYTFGPTATLKAGKTVTIRMGKGKNTSTTKYLGSTKPVMPNGKGKAQIMTYTGTVLASKSW